MYTQRYKIRACRPVVPVQEQRRHAGGVACSTCARWCLRDTTLNHSEGNVNRWDATSSFSTGFKPVKACVDDSYSGLQLLRSTRSLKNLKMMLNFFPVRKFKRNGRYIVFGAVLMVAFLAAYLQFMAVNEWSSPGEWHLMPCHLNTACWYSIKLWWCFTVRVTLLTLVSRLTTTTKFLQHLLN